MKPRNVKIAGAFVESPTDWTVTLVKSALSLHERGTFRSSARLADSMGRDARIAGALATRVSALASRSALPFQVENSDEGDGRKRGAAASRMRDLWWYSCPEDAVAPLLRDSITLGLAVGHITWTTTAGEWVPRLNWLPPHGLSYEQSGMTFGEASWIYTDADSKRHRVTPGDGTWFLHLPNGVRSWMFGAVRTLGIPWLMRDFTYRDWVRYCEKHGMPIIAVDEPNWAQTAVEGEGGSAGTLADEFFSQFANLPTESVLRFPQGGTKDEGGWAAKFLEPQSDTWGTFQAFLKELGSLVDQAILGRDGSTGPKGGDGELATERVRVERLSSDAEPLSTSLRDQVWKPWAEFNWGDRDVAGWGRWNTRPAPDLKLRAETLKTMSEAVTGLAALGIDTKPVLEEFGLESPEGGAKPPPPPAPPAPAPPADQSAAA